MRTTYPYLSAFTCSDAMARPSQVSSRPAKARSSEKPISGRLVSVCLACGKQFRSLLASLAVRHIAPFEWSSTGIASKRATSKPEVVAAV